MNEESGKSPAALNSSGDVLIRTTGTHGPDISSQRIDELDREALRHSLSLDATSAPIAIDVGCGFGAQSLRFAALGVSVLMVDLVDHRATAARINSFVGSPLCRAYHGDIRSVPEAQLPTIAHILYSQRALHYMTFQEAGIVLARLGNRMPLGAKAFISVASMNSELAENYHGQGVEVSKRLFPLCRSLAEKHDIFEPLCLYYQDEFASLLEASGFCVEKITRSEFGTWKGVFQRR